MKNLFLIIAILFSLTIYSQEEKMYFNSRATGYNISYLESSVSEETNSILTFTEHSVSFQTKGGSMSFSVQSYESIEGGVGIIMYNGGVKFVCVVETDTVLILHEDQSFMYFFNEYPSYYYN